MSQGNLRLRAAALAALLLAAAGCWNSPSNTEVHFGDVSIGQQLIDLQTALAQGAIDEEEHAALKEAILSLATVCGSRDDDE